MDNKKIYTPTIASPDQRLQLRVGVSETGQPWYRLDRGHVCIIDRSVLELYDTANRNLLHCPGEASYVETVCDETWEQPWGEQRYVRNNYHEVALLCDSFTVRFRLFDDGLGFRYEIKGDTAIGILCETTEFNISKEAHAWWIPALGHNHYEHLYRKTVLDEIDTAHTPLTIELPNGEGFVAIHEAALYDYGAMNIIPTERGLASRITPLSTGDAAQVSLPFAFPWRTIIVADAAHELGASRIMLNLNEPSKIEDTSWIQPSKFLGIWWAMFIGYFTWASGEKHGATTANAFRYINAAKKLGISGLLIEGWNEDWEGDWVQTGDTKNFMLPYPDFDIHAVTSYATSLGVDIIGHHETAGNAAHYEWQLPEAYDYYRHHGVRYIKTGYVNTKLNKDEFHSSQIGVRHYQKTVEMAAARKIMLDIHEPVKGTGIERTWPNLMTREGVMGQEYEGSAIVPEHTAILPFTRLLAGPLDYTPGLFNLSGTVRKVQTTLAKQLAFYVTMYSPLQMVADVPEHYLGHPAFQFIKDVPVNWDKTLPIDGIIGDYYVVARKDRNSDDWYVGGVSDEQPRTVTLALAFLEQHKTYQATTYCDASNADYRTNPEAYEIVQQNVTIHDVLKLSMAPGGGFAIRISPVD